MKNSKWFQDLSLLPHGGCSCRATKMREVFDIGVTLLLSMVCLKNVFPVQRWEVSRFAERTNDSFRLLLSSFYRIHGEHQVEMILMTFFLVNCKPEWHPMHEESFHSLTSICYGLLSFGMGDSYSPWIKSSRSYLSACVIIMVISPPSCLLYFCVVSLVCPCKIRYIRGIKQRSGVPF